MQIIAHRGASGYEPENTLASFKKAIELGTNGVELDVYVLKDGNVVVIHDKTVDRTTNGSGYVTEKSLLELKKLDAGNGEKIPTLKEVLDLVNRKVTVHIELKGKDTAIPVSTIIREYVKNKKWKYSDFYVSSFNHSELKNIKKLIPQVKVGALIVGIIKNYDLYKKDFGAYSVNIWYPFVGKPVVQKAHNKGLKVYVYTVNSYKDIEKMKLTGVDGIITNYPDRLK